MHLLYSRFRSSAVLLLLALAVTGGCVERKMVITSDPPGATVTINQTWTGKTPYVLPFKHYGTYDIRIEKADHYPLHVAEPITAPLYEQPGVDFVSEVLIPKKIRDVRRLHYKLEKTDQQDKLTDILGRAEEMATRTGNIAARRQERDAQRKPRSLPLPEKKTEEDDDEKDEKEAKPADPPPPEPAVEPDPVN